MDFPHVDEQTEERFARLWPLISQNETLKLAAKDTPTMIGTPSKAEKEEAGGFHYKLYENRIPPTLDAEAKFGSFATEAAKTASLDENAAFRSSKVGIDAVKKQTADQAFPENVRYYPAMSEGNRERFLAEVKKAGFTTKKVGDTPADVSYNQSPDIKAFVSRVGPIPSLAEWQTDAAKEMWKTEGEKLSQSQGKQVSRAAETVGASALRAEGKHFLADHAKGLMLPPVKAVAERAAVMKAMGEASLEDVKAVQVVTEAEHKKLSRMQYAIQIKAARAKDPDMKDETFNAMNDKERRAAADYNEVDKETFTRMIGLAYGKRALTDELKSRGEHLSRDQALDKQAKAAEQAPEEKKTAVDQKSATKVEPEQKAPEEKKVGRAGSRLGAQAAALASTLGRGG